MATDPSTALDSSRNAFGTFGGVFTPSILTILGVIMFMRTGYVVGEAGVWGALGILTLASAITFLTGLSISAISTNIQVEGGGAYFLISRSLGPAYGGAIGLALFLAQALSVPFYILGFVEAFVALVPSMSEHFFLIGATVTAVLYVVNIVGANLAIKAQYFILAVLIASVIAFLSGGLSNFSVELLQTNANPVWDENGLSFWVLFAVFFPAVTGIMAGVNMSGDLKDPAQSIPKGTLAAIAVGFVVYAAQIIITGGAIERQTLIDEPYDSLLAQAIFGFSPVVIAGVFAATLSSALGSFLGAPRILQALARDGVFPILRPFAKGSAKGDEPRRGLALTAILTVGVLYAAGNGSGGGALNAVAAVLTMFFLYTYGVTNLAAFIEHITRNPSFRPRFRFFHWSTALAGAAGCVFAAVLINPVAAVVSLALVAIVFIYIENRMLETTFGDARRGFFYARTRTNLTKLVDQTPHPKNWRPTALVLSGNPKHRKTLTQYAAWMESGRGIVTLAQVIVGKYEDTVAEREEALVSLTAYIAEHRLAAFPE
ncbi:MAG: amino acid transporter, partial [Bradymonadia bacterium]